MSGPGEHVTVIAHVAEQVEDIYRRLRRLETFSNEHAAVNIEQINLLLQQITQVEAAENIDYFPLKIVGPDDSPLNPQVGKVQPPYVASLAGDFVHARLVCSSDTVANTREFMANVYVNGVTIFGATLPTIPVGAYFGGVVPTVTAWAVDDEITARVIKDGGGALRDVHLWLARRLAA